MYGKKYHSPADVVRYFSNNPDRSAVVINFHHVTILDASDQCVIRMNLQKRFIDMLFKLVNLPGLGHCMPLVAYASRCKNEREIRSYRFGSVVGRKRIEFRFARWREEYLVGKKPGRSVVI